MVLCAVISAVTANLSNIVNLNSILKCGNPCPKNEHRTHAQKHNPNPNPNPNPKSTPSTAHMLFNESERFFQVSVGFVWD
jgi:hypothetical protein